MVRGSPLALLALAALLAAPAASACSLAYLQYQEATFGPDLWYVEGNELRAVRNGTQEVVASGFFLSYARLTDGRLLVAGQEGLSPSCSGQDWLELRDAQGTVLWRKDMHARILPNVKAVAHPYIVSAGDRISESHDDRDLYRLDGDALERLGDLPDGFVLAVDADGRAIVHDGSTLVAAGMRLPLAGAVVAAAARDGGFAVAHADGPRMHVDVAAPGPNGTYQWRNTTWDAEPGNPWHLAQVDAGWVVQASPAAFLVGPDGVLRLEVQAPVVAVAGRAGAPVVFTEQGYTVFDPAGKRAVEAWTRGGEHGEIWTPAAAVGSASPVQAETATGVGRVVSSSSDGIPGASPLVLLGCVLASLAVARRLRAGAP